MIVQSMLDRRAELHRLALHQAAGSGTKQPTHCHSPASGARTNPKWAPWASIDLSIDLSVCRSTFRTLLSIYTSSYRPTYLSIDLSIDLSIVLSSSTAYLSI